MKRNITTSIDEMQYNLAIKNGWKWSQLIKDGISMNAKPDVLHDEMKKMKAELEHLRGLWKKLDERTRTKAWFTLSRGEQQ